MKRLGVFDTANKKPNYDVIFGKRKSKITFADDTNGNIPVPPPPFLFSSPSASVQPAKPLPTILQPKNTTTTQPKPVINHKLQLRKAFRPLLQLSYDTIDEAETIGLKYNYKLDRDLSTYNTHVYVNNLDGIPLIVHRGSHTIADWAIEDVAIITGLTEIFSSPRLNYAKEITTKVEAKYGKPADAFGHSLGAHLSEHSGAKGTIMTYNKATGIQDIGKQIPDNQIDYRASKDVVSLLSTTQRRKNKLKTITDPGLFNSHTVESLPTIAEERRR